MDALVDIGTPLVFPAVTGSSDGRTNRDSWGRRNWWWSERAASATIDGRRSQRLQGSFGAPETRILIQRSGSWICLCKLFYAHVMIFYRRVCFIANDVWFIAFVSLLAFFVLYWRAWFTSGIRLWFCKIFSFEGANKGCLTLLLLWFVVSDHIAGLIPKTKWSSKLFMAILRTDILRGYIDYYNGNK